MFGAIDACRCGHASREPHGAGAGTGARSFEFGDPGICFVSNSVR